LSICDKTKAEWYVKRGLGKLIEDTPKCYRVRLKFEPSGRKFDIVMYRSNKLTSLSSLSDPSEMVKVDIQVPDGSIYARGNCGLKHKALWYVRKGLAQVIEDSNQLFCVRLNFEPDRRFFYIRIFYIQLNHKFLSITPDGLKCCEVYL